jgi:hypothetical protein
MKKITKIVVFYDDGTFSESVPSVEQPITPLPYPPMKPIGPSDWPLPQSPTPNWYGNCPQCGLKLEGCMGYVCSNAKCPTGLGGAWCSTQSNT